MRHEVGNKSGVIALANILIRCLEGDYYFAFAAATALYAGTEGSDGIRSIKRPLKRTVPALTA